MIINQDESIISDFSVILAGFYQDKILLHSSGGVVYLTSIMMPNDLTRVGICNPYKLTALGKALISRHYPFFDDTNMREKLIFYIEKGVEMRFKLANLIVFEVPEPMKMIGNNFEYYDFFQCMEDSSLLMTAATSMLICEAFDLHEKN